MKNALHLFALVVVAVSLFALIGCATNEVPASESVLEADSVVNLSTPVEKNSPNDKSIYFTGYGSTIDQARSNARADLNAFFNGILVESSSSIQVSDNSLEGASYDVYLASNSSSRGYLKCVEYINEKKQGNQYSSTAIITDSSENMMVILNEMNSISSSLTKMEAMLDKLQKQDKANAFLQMYNMLVEYECYSYILMHMGYGSLIPPLSIQESSRSAYFQYQVVMSEIEQEALKSKTISFTGYGQTIDEARAKARADLNAFFNGVLMDSYSSVSGSSNGEVPYESYLDSRSYTWGYLKCVEYTNEKKQGNQYSSTAVITDSPENVKMIANDMKSINSSLSKMNGMLENQQKTVRAESLLQMYDMLVEYECYSYILIRLGYESSIPTLSIQESSKSIYFQYQALIKEIELEKEQEALYPKSISFTGYGSTIDEARAKARTDLTAYFNGMLMDSYSASVFDDSNGDVSYETYLESRSYTWGYLRCVEYVNETKENGKYSSTAVITNSPANMKMISSELNSLCSSISKMNDMLQKQSKADRADTLLQMYDLLVQYECFSFILIRLGNESDIPSLPIQENSKSIYYQYQVLMKELEKAEPTDYEVIDKFLLEGTWTGQVVGSTFVDYYTLVFKDNNSLEVTVESIDSNGNSTSCSGTTKYKYTESTQILVVNIPQMKGNVSHLTSINWKTMVAVFDGDFSYFTVSIPVSSGSSKNSKTTFYRE